MGQTFLSTGRAVREAGWLVDNIRPSTTLDALWTLASEIAGRHEVVNPVLAMDCNVNCCDGIQPDPVVITDQNWPGIHAHAMHIESICVYVVDADTYQIPEPLL